MNNRIFNLIVEKIQDNLNLPKYDGICAEINKNTVIADIPWTPARYRKFTEAISAVLDLECTFDGTLEEVVHRLDVKYSGRFFGEIWNPTTDKYQYTGWDIVNKINELAPARVLDVGCGYNQFKQRIPNLTGIDAYNNSADYQVDILDFVDTPESFDAIIALGSINFNSQEDIRQRLKICIDLLSNGGRMFLRVNPGELHEHGPYVDIFPWSFKYAQEFAKEFNVELETFKQDNANRLYFVYLKNI